MIEVNDMESANDGEFFRVSEMSSDGLYKENNKSIKYHKIPTLLKKIIT
jgi:hypothetical protein